MSISPLPASDAPTTPPASKGIRRVHSTESLGTPLQPTLASLVNDNSDLPYPGLSAAHVSAHHSPYLSSPQRKASHSRGLSFEGGRLFSKSQVNLIPTSSSTLDLTSGSKHLREKGTVVTKNISPTRFCSILTSTSSTQLDVEEVKKLRLLLRNETASYVQFSRCSGKI